MQSKQKATGKTIIDQCVAPWVRAELEWRFLFADGEIANLPGHGKALDRLDNFKPIEQVAELRCGPVYVGTAQPPSMATWEIDFAPVESVMRQRAVDAALVAIGPEAAVSLWLALGARLRTGLVPFGPLCNLLAVEADATFRAWTADALLGADEAAEVKQLGRWERRDLLGRAEQLQAIEWLERRAERFLSRTLLAEELELITLWHEQAQRRLYEAGRAYDVARR